MTEHQEWVIAWLAAGGLFFMVIQIIKWFYYIVNYPQAEDLWICHKTLMGF